MLRTKEEKGNLEGYQQQVALKTCLQKEWDKITPERLHHLVSVPKCLLSVMVTGKCFTVPTFFCVGRTKIGICVNFEKQKQKNPHKIHEEHIEYCAVVLFSM